jgi:transposase InsO family protein
MLLLDRAFKRFGVPVQVLTDQGTQFKPAIGDLSAFDIHCYELGIEYICASVRRPTACGKIEAFHKAYEVVSHLFREHWSFIRYYNYTRPHEGLKYLIPAEIYLNVKV